MVKDNSNFVKILFRFYSNVLEKETVERLWAEVIDKENGIYKVDSIPFYAQMAAPDDLVFAEYDETEKWLTYRYSVQLSGNSVIQVVIMNKATITNDIRDIFNNLGCQSEKFQEGYFVLEIPANKSYLPIRERLIEFKDKGFIDFAEANLSDNHWYGEDLA